jgi:hypothetical protein
MLPMSYVAHRILNRREPCTLAGFRVKNIHRSEEWEKEKFKSYEASSLRNFILWLLAIVSKSFKIIVRITIPTIGIRDYKSPIERGKMALFCEASSLRSFILWLLAIVNKSFKSIVRITNPTIGIRDDKSRIESAN